MASTYSHHLIGPNIASLADFPFVQYNPNDLAASQKASDAALKEYLGNSTNRHNYNQSFANIKTDFYNNGTQVGYVNPLTNQLIGMPNGTGIDASAFYNSNQFSKDMLKHLTGKNVDFANYVIKDTPAGTSLESVVTESGETISVDPSFSQSTISQFGWGGLLAGLSFPAIGYGIRNIKTGSGKTTSIFGLKVPAKAVGYAQVSAGLGTNIWFGCNFIDSACRYGMAGKYAEAGLMSKLLGIKGLCFNSGMFLVGNGLYNIFSSLKDYKKDHANKGMALTKASMGGLEIASGSCFISAGTKAMTSLIYEGSGLFSVSTQGLAAILSTTIPFGIGLGIAALIAGAFYLAKWHKNKKTKNIKYWN